MHDCKQDVSRHEWKDRKTGTEGLDTHTKVVIQHGTGCENLEGDQQPQHRHKYIRNM